MAKTVQQQLESTARVTTYIHVKYEVWLIDLCFHLQDTANSVSLQGPANGMIDCLCHLFTHIMSSSVLCAVIGHLSQPMGSLFQESIKKTCAKLFNNAFMQKVFTSVFYYMYMRIKTSAFSTPELKAQVNFSDRLLSICELFTSHFLKNHTTVPVSTKFGTEHSWVKGIWVCSNERPSLFQGEMIVKLHWQHLKFSFSRTTRRFIQMEDKPQ